MLTSRATPKCSHQGTQSKKESKGQCDAWSSNDFRRKQKAEEQYVMTGNQNWTKIKPYPCLWWQKWHKGTKGLHQRTKHLCLREELSLFRSYEALLQRLTGCTQFGSWFFLSNPERSLKHRLASQRHAHTPLTQQTNSFPNLRKTIWHYVYKQIKTVLCVHLIL